MKPTVLCILDGWGHREETEHNAIALADTPNWDRLWKHYPHTVINASAGYVGLPEGQMGNSEVGHMNIGSGRIVMQDLPKIDAAIEDGSLENNKALLRYCEFMQRHEGAVHIMGLLSDGGVHSHQKHIQALAAYIAKRVSKVYIHAFLDGRDTPPSSALGYIRTLEEAIEPLQNVEIATVSGRFYAMDRDQNWDRVEQAYQAIIRGKGLQDATASDAVNASYKSDVTDEFVIPCVISDYAGMEKQDGLIMANFRADRVREILQSILDPDFDKFARINYVNHRPALGLTEYSTMHNAWLETVFPPEELHDTLGEVVANAGLKQLRIAETEKYAHVTFFFNGGREKELKGEHRILVPSPKVKTYDLKPEMSAVEVTDKLVEAIESEEYDLIVVNYANTDMVGHTGHLGAAIKAVEAVDACVDRVQQAVQKQGGAMLITADHGNAELMHNDTTGDDHTAHTTNLVPVIAVSDALKGQRLQVKEGKLADIAPTILTLMGIAIPEAMSGNSLLSDA
jgi:2,3-bisphosphoglycerate-independent phosphoglycerate mutase